MSEVPKELKYAQTHEWVRVQEDQTVVVGITDYAQESLGDITYIEMPEDGREFERGETFGVVESVKAASDLHMPISGKILEVNPDIDGTPELVNDTPYAEGWMIHVKPKNLEELEKLLTPEAYKVQL